MIKTRETATIYQEEKKAGALSLATWNNAFHGNLEYEFTDIICHVIHVLRANEWKGTLEK